MVNTSEITSGSIGNTIPDSSKNTGNVVPDSSHPFFLHPFDSPGLTLVNSSFDEPSDYKLWNRCNDMVISWLLNSLSKNIADSVIYSKTTKDLWEDLEDRFGQLNDTLNTNVNCACACDCGGKAKVAKSLQDERIVKFLEGLNETYASVKSNILMLLPLPSIGHAYALLMQDEKQIEVYVNSQFPGDSSSF
uniref:Retrotransposon Copia-like N-terminal domain-containing protein n=1 Tax=Nicotiana tabacum TaxID=4097 RepID=A0A1S4A983_TOBAC|nr:PREDICTED: uncharacterized protein LOC107795129 [Nicotiana tabacum]